MTDEALIKAAIAETLGVEIEDVTPSAKLQEDLHMDSLDAIELVVDLEGRFNIIISDEAATKAETVADIIRMVQELAK